MPVHTLATGVRTTAIAPAKYLATVKRARALAPRPSASAGHHPLDKAGGAVPTLGFRCWTSHAATFSPALTQPSRPVHVGAPHSKQDRRLGRGAFIVHLRT
jgi:hypothetical protein